MDASRLSAIPLFAGLTDRELAAVASAASEASAEKGQTLAAAERLRSLIVSRQAAPS